MIHLVKVDLINLFISILCFTKRNFHLIPAALFIFFMGLCMDFFYFCFLLLRVELDVLTIEFCRVIY